MKHKKDKRDSFSIPVQWTSLTGMTRTNHVLCSASTNPLGAVNRYHIVTAGPCLKLIPDRPLQPIINAKHIYISNNFRQLFLKLYKHAYKENLI